MSKLLVFGLGSFLACVAGCTPNSRPPATVPPAETSAEPTASETGAGAAAPAEAAEAEPTLENIPTECATNDPCVPDPAYVKRFCNGNYPDVALVLMGKDTPFTRMYMRGDVDGWNADGGTSTRAKLFFDEEVLMLKRRSANPNAIVVGSGAAFLVMRWDGNCYTLTESEVTTKKPPKLKNGPIPWRYYSDRTKEALLKNAKIQTALQRRDKECKGAMSGEVPAPCEQATTALSATVVAEVRGGASIPTPEHRP